MFRPHFLGWNTKISARKSNYGTRVDFILITPNLIPWIAAADIQPEIKGSDHCPVFVDFRDEIMNANGVTIKLRDVLGVQATSGKPKEPPRMAAKFWDEHSGKQTLLEKFFGKQPMGTQALEPPPTLILVSDASGELLDRESSSSVAQSPCPSNSKSHDPPNPFSSSPSVTSPAILPTLPTSKRKNTVQTTTSKKLKLMPTRKNEIGKPKEKKPGQSKIASFFSQPKDPNSQTSSSSSTTSISKGKERAHPQVDEDADYRLALLLSSQESTTCSSSSQDRPEKETTQAWNDLLAPIQPPKCIVHGEPAREFTVNKQGPNKGKKFFICSR